MGAKVGLVVGAGISMTGERVEGTRDGTGEGAKVSVVEGDWSPWMACDAVGDAVRKGSLGDCQASDAAGSVVLELGRAKMTIATTDSSSDRMTRGIVFRCRFEQPCRHNSLVAGSGSNQMEMVES